MRRALRTPVPALGTAAAVVAVVLAGMLLLAPSASASPTPDPSESPSDQSSGSTSPQQTCPTLDLRKAVADSTVVFHGRVSAAGKSSDGGNRTTFPVAVQVPFKGKARDSVRVTLTQGPCRPHKVTVDEDYIFFLSEGKPNLVASGDAPTVLPYSENLNQQLHELVDLPSTDVSFGEVIAGEPRAFTRLAAPGAALILIGGLGLVVVRWLRRRAA